MRAKFDMQLDELNRSLIKMGAMCESAIAAAVKALLERDMSLVKEVDESEREIDQMERDIETLCMKLILQQQPVARDLRVISSALKMITDMERIGDQASDIANIVETCNLDHDKCHDDIAEMASATISMVIESIDAFVKKDTEAVKKVIAADDKVDGLFVKVKSDIINMIAENPDSGEKAVDILMVAKYLERIGDHATNIAEWVEYSLTGAHE